MERYAVVQLSETYNNENQVYGVVDNTYGFVVCTCSLSLGATPVAPYANGLYSAQQIAAALNESVA